MKRKAKVKAKKAEKKPKPRLLEPVSFISFRRTDSGCLAEVTQLGYRDKTLHGKTIKILADKIHKLLLAEGVK